MADLACRMLSQRARYRVGDFARSNWPYLALLIFFVLPLLWMTTVVAVGADMFWLRPERGTDTSPSDQVQILLSFVGGGLATAASLCTALLTHDHRKRKRKRQQLEAVLRSLEALPVKTPARVAGVLTSLVLLGYHRVALRVLEPAWKNGEVDSATATWVIDEVLWNGMAPRDSESDQVDAVAINEAADLLVMHVDKLTNEGGGEYSFPTHFVHEWPREGMLSPEAEDSLLRAIGRLLVSRSKEFWCSGDEPPELAGAILECFWNGGDDRIRGSAALLLAALMHHFPKSFERYPGHETVKQIYERAALAEQGHQVDQDYIRLAVQLRDRWGSPDPPDAKHRFFSRRIPVPRSSRSETAGHLQRSNE